MSPGVLDIDNEEPPRLSNAANAAMSKPEKELEIMVLRSLRHTTAMIMLLEYHF